MSNLASHVLVVAGGYFAIMNPIANAAIFTSLTAGMDERVVRRIALRSVVTAFAVVLAFILLGKLVFEFFGITLPALRIAGGIMVFLIGYHMLHGRPSAFHAASGGVDDGADSIAVSPLGIPILAGPGTIAVSMSYSATSDLLQIGVNALVFLALCAVTYLCFRLGERVENRIGASGLRVTTQLMGLILAVIGVQMGVDGVLGAVDLHLHPAGG
ncbi:MAG: MarC family protein [Gammaproteobacteria bacterium]|nr:MarC family protein [Gammaproteobacteria bacterium]